MSDREKKALAKADDGAQASIADRLNAAFEDQTEILFGGVPVKIISPTTKAVTKYQTWLRAASEPLREVLDDPEAIKDPKAYEARLSPEERDEFIDKSEFFQVESTLKILRLVAPELNDVTDERLLFFVQDEGGDMCPLLRKARNLVRAGARVSDPFGSRASTASRRRKRS